eukprot:4600713-Lingulodinium_polyedra.AAC.1
MICPRTSCMSPDRLWPEKRWRMRRRAPAGGPMGKGAGWAGCSSNTGGGSGGSGGWDGGQRRSS